MKRPWATYAFQLNMSERLTRLSAEQLEYLKRIAGLERSVADLQNEIKYLTRDFNPNDDNHWNYSSHLNLWGLRSVLVSVIEYLGLEVQPPSPSGYRVIEKQKAKK